MSSNTYLNALGIACGVGFLAYCIYFDRKRRNAPDYEANVRARRETERLAKEKADEIELPSPDDKEAFEKFFAREMEIGEELIHAGEVDRAVKHLSYAVALCPQSQQLLLYMQEILPSTAYAKLVACIPDAKKKIADAYRLMTDFQDEDVE